MPNYKCEGGIAFETKDTKQNMLRGKKRSGTKLFLSSFLSCAKTTTRRISIITTLVWWCIGDGTVPYSSMAYCKFWQNQGVDVEIIELDGADHRAILKNKTFTREVCKKRKSACSLLRRVVSYSGISYLDFELCHETTADCTA